MAEAIKLNYAPPTRAKWRSRLRRITIALVLAGAGAVLVAVVWQCINQIPRVTYDWHVAHWSAGPNVAVFSDYPSDNGLAQAGEYKKGKLPFVFYQPGWLAGEGTRGYVSTINSFAALVFAGELHGPGGHRLVIVRADAISNLWGLQADGWEYAALGLFGDSPNRLTGELTSVPKSGHLRIFAGQPDPSDASHFTIRYQTDAGEGLIDGWLTPDDKILLEERRKPAASQP